jgi:YD repeat-containing protein
VDYGYDAVGSLSGYTYANGVQTSYSYGGLNRLTQMGSSNNSTAISNYAYTLGFAGNRLTVAELSGRAVAYAYDSLYRLTSETVSADPNNKNGAINYTYDAVGNRKTLNATLPPAGGISYTYDADDRLGSDQYDSAGNTTNSGGIGNTYDFENHLITHGGVTVVYDGDGNRVAETVAYAYDSLYRLTTETVSADPHNNNGVGNLGCRQPSNYTSRHLTRLRVCLQRT